MFSKLKDKLKSAISIFSKRKEDEIIEEAYKEERPEEISLEEAKEKAEEIKEEIKEEVKEEKKEEIREEAKEEKKKEVREEKKEEIKKETKKTEEVVPKNIVKITYFVHGTTLDNEKEISSGWKDVELSEKGIHQSKELINNVKDKTFDAVFSSDLRRAVESARLTWGNAVKIIQDKRLRECNYGDYNGKASSFVESMQEEAIDKQFPNGESYEDVKRRISEFLNYLFENYTGKHIAIVAHKAPQLALEVILKKKTWEQAFAEDWRKRNAWRPGWEYKIKEKIFFPESSKTNLHLGKKFPDITQIPEKKLETKQEIVFPKTEVIDEEAAEKGFFVRLKEKLTATKISAKEFEELFGELELILLENNVSLEVVEKIKFGLKRDLVDKPLQGKVEDIVQESLKKTVEEVLNAEPIDLIHKVRQKKPFIIAFFGINGAGKTTTLAKVAHKLKKQGLSVVLAASDTFRAAAIQQLEEQGERVGARVIKHDYGSDAAAVAFDAVKYAEKNDIDAVLVDTAGRLHSNTNLLAELKKIVKVIKPDFKIFIGESITGNDCLEQIKEFNEQIGIDGVILTKADVDEKGGTALSVAYTTKKPILYLGIGQRLDDLEEFNKEKMVKRLGL